MANYAYLFKVSHELSSPFEGGSLALSIEAEFDPALLFELEAISVTDP